jgi:hypothetical protein
MMKLQNKTTDCPEILVEFDAPQWADIRKTKKATKNSTTPQNCNF